MQPTTVIVSGPAVINETVTALPATVNITITNDGYALETVEEFSISLSSSDPSVVIGGSGLFGTAQISITDDDGEPAELRSDINCCTITWPNAS